MPALLQGMVSQIFDRRSGRIYDEDELRSRGSASDVSTIIESVRQLCLTFKKVEVSCSPERVEAALETFVSIERSFKEFTPSDVEVAEFRAVSTMLWGNMVRPLGLSNIFPGHGPGATAERISGNQKFNWRRWHDRLEPYFPLVDNGFPIGIPMKARELEIVTIIPQDGEQPVRVVPVPKTLKGPRIIAIEPCCMQFVQQGIRNVLYRAIESYWLTAGHVNFSDQTVNQKLAIEASSTGQFATIDLSEASDRVPLSLALVMFETNPDLRDAILACRSTKAEMPDGTIIGPLGKFASMGSALCFPIEAMYFYTSCVVASLKGAHLSLTPSNIFKVSRGVFVYGDDIVVPTRDADIVLDHLRKYNCKVNASKTFVGGSFRESCGVDAYRGEQVTPVYLRRMRPENKQQSSNIISWVETANLFYKRGYWSVAQLMFLKLEQVLGMSIPYIDDDGEGLGRFSYMGRDLNASQRLGRDARTLIVKSKDGSFYVQCYSPAEKWDYDTQRLKVRTLVPGPVYQPDTLDGYGALFKSLSSLTGASLFDYRALKIAHKRWDLFIKDLISKDEHHLERFALHGAVTLKRRWVPAQ
jgi:hypothetical protein